MSVVSLPFSVIQPSTKNADANAGASAGVSIPEATAMEVAFHAVSGPSPTLTTTPKLQLRSNNRSHPGRCH